MTVLAAVTWYVLLVAGPYPDMIGMLSRKDCRDLQGIRVRMHMTRGDCIPVPSPGKDPKR